MSVVDITSLARLSLNDSRDLNLTELQKKHLDNAIMIVERYAVKSRLICHTPKIRNGQLQLGLDL